MTKPYDPLQDLSQEEIAAKLEEVRDRQYSRKEEWFLIWTALKVVMPIVLLVCFVYWMVFWIFM